MIDLYKELENCKVIGITGHTRPDGDCIGSVMGMYLYLSKILPGRKIIPMIEKPADEFSCIAKINDICVSFEPGVDHFDAFVGLDCSSPERYAEAEKFFEDADKKIVVDHHISNEGFGDIAYIDPEASSTCELVYDLLDKEYMDEDIALAIYIGIIHDTGVLKYSNVSPKTLRICAELISYGFDFPSIIDSTFYERTKAQNKILGHVLLESSFYEDGKVIAATVDLDMINECGAVPHDMEGIVEQLRFTEGVEVAVFLHEKEPQVFKVSLRSCGLVDVSVIAKHFDGGGHKRAAGFTLNGTSEENLKLILEQIKMQL